MSEIHSFVFAATLLGVFALIVSLAPVGLYLTTDSTPVPNLFQSADIAFTSYHSFEINDTECPAWQLSRAHEYDLEGLTYLFYLIEYDGEYQAFQLGTIMYVLGLPFVSLFEFSNWEGASVGATVTRDQMNYDFSRNGENVLQYEFSHRSASGTLLLTWANTTAYATPYEAFVAKHLVLLHGIQITEQNTTAGQSGLAFLLSILTWTNPNVHPLLNGFIAIPMYALLGYLGFLILMKFIHG